LDMHPPVVDAGRVSVAPRARRRDKSRTEHAHAWSRTGFGLDAVIRGHEGSSRRLRAPAHFDQPSRSTKFTHLERLSSKIYHLHLVKTIWYMGVKTRLIPGF